MSLPRNRQRLMGTAIRMIARFMQDFPAPVRREGEAAVELVIDYRTDPIKPAVNFDWERLSQGDLSASLAVKNFSGQQDNLELTIGQLGREVIDRIREQYGDENATPVEGNDASAFANGWLDRAFSSSPSGKVGNLIAWQQFLELAEVLEVREDDGPRWERFRQNLLGFYERSFDQLRGRVRDRKLDGTGLVRQLLDSRNEPLVDIALRLTTLEPSLAAEVRDEITAVAEDVRLPGDLRDRASSQL